MLMQPLIDLGACDGTMKISSQGINLLQTTTQINIQCTDVSPKYILLEFLGV